MAAPLPSRTAAADAPVPMANQCWPTPPLDLSNTISRSGSVSWRVIFPFPSILVHARICALLEWRLCFPWPCWDPIIKSHWASKVRFTGGSHSFCQIPRLGSLKWGSEPSQQWDNFLGIIILQIVNRLPGRYWICPLSCFWSSYHLFFWLLLHLWMWDIFFWSVPASSCQWLFNS